MPESPLTDTLVLTAAALSLVKTLVSVGTYSHFHTVMSVVELLCTSVALILFLLQTSLEQVGGWSRVVFIMAFVLSIELELMDALVTNGSVELYSKLVESESAQFIEKIRRRAGRNYLWQLLYLGMTEAIFPLVAFSKADWKTSLFNPANLSEEVYQITFVCLLMQLIGLNSTLLFERYFFNCAEVFQCWILLMSLAIFSLYVVVMVRLDDAVEAGSLTFVLVLVATQAIETGASVARKNVWLEEFVNKHREAQEKVEEP